MAGRFGKYGDTKRKALIRKNRLKNQAKWSPKKGREDDTGGWKKRNKHQK